MPSVFVSGANGYIAQHIVVQLAHKGYKVIGSVRSKEKGENLKKNVPSFEYEVIEDIGKEGAFDVVKKYPEIEGFFHVASPITIVKEDWENQIIKPAIEGTKNVLAAVKKYAPKVRRVIVTSSAAAVISPEYKVITEDSWFKVDKNSAKDSLLAYSISKTYAEKEVWNFVEQEKPQFTANTIAPVFVFGPQAFDKDNVNMSVGIVDSILKLKADLPIPETVGGFIDVRDVAKAHIFAFEKDVVNTRFLLFEERFSSQMLLDIVNKHFSELKLPEGKKGTARDFSSRQPIDNSKTRDLLGAFVSLEQSIVDTVKQKIKD